MITLNIGEAVKFRIVELCNRHNITINKLATISGVTRSALNNITGGRTKEQMYQLLKSCVREQGFFNSEISNNLEQEIK